MPTNTISGSSGSSPGELYQITQANNQVPGANKQQSGENQESRAKEEIFKVEISQEALALQKRQQEQSVEREAELRADREVAQEAESSLQQQRAEAEETTAQNSIDITV